MIQMEGLHKRLLCNVAAIARALPKYDRIAFIELLCEYQEALPQERPGFSDRFEPYLNFAQAHCNDRNRFPDRP
jgi:hypothetical protein